MTIIRPSLPAPHQAIQRGCEIIYDLWSSLYFELHSIGGNEPLYTSMYKNQDGKEILYQFGLIGELKLFTIDEKMNQPLSTFQGIFLRERDTTDAVKMYSTDPLWVSDTDEASINHLRKLIIDSSFMFESESRSYDVLDQVTNHRIACLLSEFRSMVIRYG